MSFISVRYTFFTLLIILASTFLHGKLIVQNEPTTIIKGINSCLQRPEGVSYSPSGHCIAVACSSSNSISLYKRIGNAGIKYETSPYCVIQHSKLLHYAHDVNFSPCGQFLAVANRESNKVVIYKMNDLEKCTVNHIPHCILDSHIDNPTSVSFSPCGKVLAVCSRKGRGITFYREIENTKGKYYPVPFYELTEEKLLEYGLSSPHGIAFSPDGKSIGIVHKRYFKNIDSKGESALAIFDKVEDTVDDVSYIPSCIVLQRQTCLHSIAFHPSGDYLATVDEQFKVRMYSKNEHNQYEQNSEIPIIMPGTCTEGPKGVAFSADGKSFAITTMEPSIFIYEIEELRH